VRIVFNLTIAFTRNERYNIRKATLPY